MPDLFDFSSASPPLLTERQLQKRLAARRLWQQAVLLAVAAALYCLCLALLAVFLKPLYPLLSILCWGGLVFSVLGSAVLALFFVRKRRNFLC